MTGMTSPDQQAAFAAAVESAFAAAGVPTAGGWPLAGAGGGGGLLQVGEVAAKAAYSELRGAPLPTAPPAAAPLEPRPPPPPPPPPPESVPKAEFVELREKFEALQAKYYKDVGKEQQRAARAEALSEEKDNTIKKLDKQLAEASKQTEKLIDVVKELVIRTGGGAAAAAKSSSAR